MDVITRVVDSLASLVWDFGIPVGGETVPLLVLFLIGTGAYLTIRLGCVQLRRFAHGVAVATGRYDRPDDPGDVTHFQALSTALSATVGIGNIAGVAIALHWGGPGALFWMWLTAFLGMATKYTEVTLAQHYRVVDPRPAGAESGQGSVSGGPMFYIEQGLGLRWRPLAVVFAICLAGASLLIGNGVQSNTVADVLRTEFAVPTWASGLTLATLVAVVIIGGIGRIGRVAGVLAPAMASIYVAGGCLILLLNADQIVPSLRLIVSEALNPTAGVAGAGAGAFLVTLLWGVRRGLFSNEAGMGSAPIAHAAAKTDEPVSEGTVALLEPFVDTIVVCSITALSIIVTSTWDDRVPTRIDLDAGAISFVQDSETGVRSYFVSAPEAIEVSAGVSVGSSEEPRLAWHEVPLDVLYVDADQQIAFSGTVFPQGGSAVATDGTEYDALFADAALNGAPLTMEAFRRGIPGSWGSYIVLAAVLLFALSTSIAWSYYGDRCVLYVFGSAAVLPFKVIYVAVSVLGAVLPLTVAWTLGDVFLGAVIIPNLIALILLAPQVQRLTSSYFSRKPWNRSGEREEAAGGVGDRGHGGG